MEEREAVYWKSSEHADEYKVRVFRRTEKPGEVGTYAGREEVFTGTVDFQTLERLMADQPETRWVHFNPAADPSALHMEGAPEFVGKLPVRTELTVLPADDPKQKKIGFAVYEITAGADVLKVPTGMSIEEAVEALKVGGAVAFGIATTETDLEAGDVVITQGLFGYIIGPVIREGNSVYMESESGMIGMLQWNSGLEQPRWTCPGHINSRAIKHTELER